MWFQGRTLWTFSKAYNVIEKNPEYLKVAKNIFEFLPKCTDSDGRMFFTVTEDGKEIQKRRYYFSETFAAIGCAEYYKATKDKSALMLAEKYFNIAYECYLGNIKNLPKFNLENHKFKSLSPVMILLSTAQTLRSVPELKNKYDSISQDFLNEIMDGGFLTEKGLLEHVGTDNKAVDSPTGRIVNPGHSLETAWFIMSEGLITKNDEALCFAKKIIDITLPLGIDKKHGGIISFTDCDGKPPIQLEWDMKLWWPQCEAMIAMRIAHRIFNEKRYNDVYENLKHIAKNISATIRTVSGMVICIMITQFPRHSKETYLKVLFIFQDVT